MALGRADPPGHLDAVRDAGLPRDALGVLLGPVARRTRRASGCASARAAKARTSTNDPLAAPMRASVTIRAGRAAGSAAAVGTSTGLGIVTVGRPAMAPISRAQLGVSVTTAAAPRSIHRATRRPGAGMPR